MLSDWKVCGRIGSDIERTKETLRFGGCGVRRSGNGCVSARLIGKVGLAQFLFDLEFELIAGAAKFSDELAELAADFGQLFGAENDQGQNENKNCVGQTHRIP